MKTWVFNQVMLDYALAKHAKKLQADGTSDRAVEIIGREIRKFLESDAAIEAKMLLKGPSSEAQH